MASDSGESKEKKKKKKRSKKIKKAFRAYSLEDGMKIVKKEMGPQVTIVSVKKVPSRSRKDVMVVEIVAEAPAPEEKKGKGDPVQDSSSIGGLGKQLAKVREVVVLPLRYPEMFARLGISPPKGVLMYGPPGTGKTLTARSVAEECGATFFAVNGPELLGGAMGESEKNLREVFEKATTQAPSLIFFDEIDAIAVQREDAGSGAEKRLVTQLLTLMDGVDDKRGRVIVLAATNRPDAIDSALRRPGRFDREVEIPIPDEESRLEIIKIHTKGMALASDVDPEKIASEAHGYVGADIAHLCKEAGMLAIREAMPAGGQPPPTLQVNERHFEAAMEEITPSGMKGAAAAASNITFDDVGGLAEVKRDLEEAIVLPLKRPELFKQMDIRPSKGVLLAGRRVRARHSSPAPRPASAVSTLSLSTGLPSYQNSWAKQRNSFVKFSRRPAMPARASSSLTSLIRLRRSVALDPKISLPTGSSRNCSLRWTASIPARPFSAWPPPNRPEAIDPAVRRPGRFDKVIEIPLPDEESRKHILDVHLRQKPLEKNIDMDELTTITMGFSGAEIEEACRRAAMEAVRKSISATATLEPAISHRDLVRVFTDMAKATGKEVQEHEAASTHKAMVVDDNDYAREFAAEAVKLAGLDPVTFEDPEKAVEALETQHFDVVVLDVDMPKMNGMEVLAHIRKVLPNLPVIMATGNKEAITKTTSFKLGATDYLTKPYSVQDLVDRVKEALGNGES